MKQASSEGNMRSDPFTERLGISSQLGGNGAVVTTKHCAPDECNIYGVVHGALLFAMADVGMGMALAAALPGKPRLGSISINANYIRAGKPGLLKAESQLVRAGRAVAFLESEIRDGECVVCAQFSGVFHIYPNGNEKT